MVDVLLERLAGGIYNLLCWLCRLRSCRLRWGLNRSSVGHLCSHRDVWKAFLAGRESKIGGAAGAEYNEWWRVFVQEAAVLI